jgi:hypothetical protein
LICRNHVPGATAKVVGLEDVEAGGTIGPIGRRNPVVGLGGQGPTGALERGGIMDREPLIHVVRIAPGGLDRFPAPLYEVST